LLIVLIDQNLEELVCGPGWRKLFEVAGAGGKTRYGCAARDKRGFESMGLERAGESPGTHQVADAEQVLHIKQNFWTGVHGVAFAILSP